MSPLRVVVKLAELRWDRVGVPVAGKPPTIVTPFFMAKLMVRLSGPVVVVGL